jgi:hypothetical protein
MLLLTISLPYLEFHEGQKSETDGKHDAQADKPQFVTG